MPYFSAEHVPFWTAVAALAAAATALVTAAYTYFTLRLVRAQAEPKVIVYVRHDLDRPSILSIIIENIGRDIAHDVRFVPSRPIPARAFGIELPPEPTAEVMTDGALVHGIPSLGPGDSRVVTWGQYGGLSAALKGAPIALQFSYRHGRRTLKGEAKLEVQSYRNTDASEGPILASARALKSLSEAMRHIAKDVHAIAEHTTSESSNDTAARRSTPGT